MSILAMEFKKNCNLPLSSMNKQGDSIFSSACIRNCRFNRWFTDPKSNDLNAYD